MDKWAELRAFVAVVEHEGFAPAARTLKVAPSGVSRLITNLEARLGTRLLNRTTRQVSLTDAGERFYARGRDLLHGFEAAEEEVLGLQSEPRGLLRISCVVTLAERWMPGILADFLAGYPETAVELRETDRPIDLIGEGVDVAIVSGALADSSHRVRRLSGFHRFVVAAPDYLERRGRPETPGDLKDHDCLAFATAPHLQKWAFQAGDRGPVETKVRGRFSATGAETILRAALAGIGIARLAGFMVAPHLRSGALEEVLAAFRQPDPVALSAVYPSSGQLSPKIRAFLDHLADHFGPTPPWDSAGPPQA